MLPVAVLLAACGTLTVEAEEVMRYMQATAASLHAPDDYVRSVLTAPLGQTPAAGSGL